MNPARPKKVIHNENNPLNFSIDIINCKQDIYRTTGPSITAPVSNRPDKEDICSDHVSVLVREPCGRSDICQNLHILKVDVNIQSRCFEPMKNSFLGTSWSKDGYSTGWPGMLHTYSQLWYLGERTRIQPTDPLCAELGVEATGRQITFSTFQTITHTVTKTIVGTSNDTRSGLEGHTTIISSITERNSIIPRYANSSHELVTEGLSSASSYPGVASSVWQNRFSSLTASDSKNMSISSTRDCHSESIYTQKVVDLFSGEM